MLIVPFVLLFLAGSAVASPLCASATGLSAYIANYQGFANACLIGDKLFYDFSFVVNGGTVIPDVGAITITPDVTSPILNPGLRISSGAFFLFVGQTLDATITYRIATESGSALL
jgi:hypothetical protein